MSARIRARLGFVAQTDSQFDPQMLARFVEAYQRVQPLTIGELRAVAITLRIVLVENLRRAAEQIAAAAAGARLTDWRIGSSAPTARNEEPVRLRATIRPTPVPTAFAEQLLQRLRDQDPKVTPRSMAGSSGSLAQGTTADEIVREVHQGQGAMNVTVRNVITSMRLMSAVDWAEFFESVSRSMRCCAPTAILPRWILPRGIATGTRSKLARGSAAQEVEVAQRAIAPPARPPLRGRRKRRRGAAASIDPGYYLISRRAAARSRKDRLSRPGPRLDGSRQPSAGIVGYLGTIASSPRSSWPRPPDGLSHRARRMDARWCSRCSRYSRRWMRRLRSSTAPSPADRPATIPALELHDGVPAEPAHIVVVPTFWPRATEIEEQIERLEVHYLASEDGDLHLRSSRLDLTPRPRPRPVTTNCSRAADGSRG